ncbi:MAG: hypothetical protein R3F14_23975 [Polyangiaceae bacterium]
MSSSTVSPRPTASRATAFVALPPGACACPTSTTSAPGSRGTRSLVAMMLRVGLFIR